MTTTLPAATAPGAPRATRRIRRGWAELSARVTVEQERTYRGITLPTVVRAGWWRRTDRQDEGEFFRARITAALFR